MIGTLNRKFTISGLASSGCFHSFVSAITVAPALAGNTVVVVTAKGGVFGYRPE